MTLLPALEKNVLYSKKKTQNKKHKNQQVLRHKTSFLNVRVFLQWKSSKQAVGDGAQRVTRVHN
jgi:hypothetical protein